MILWRSQKYLIYIYIYIFDTLKEHNRKMDKLFMLKLYINERTLYSLIIQSLMFFIMIGFHSTKYVI